MVYLSKLWQLRNQSTQRPLAFVLADRWNYYTLKIMVPKAFSNYSCSLLRRSKDVALSSRFRPYALPIGGLAKGFITKWLEQNKWLNKHDDPRTVDGLRFHVLGQTAVQNVELQFKYECDNEGILAWDGTYLPQNRLGPFMPPCSDSCYHCLILNYWAPDNNPYLASKRWSTLYYL